MKVATFSFVIGCLVAVAIIYLLDLESRVTMAFVFVLCVGAATATAGYLRRGQKEKPAP